MPTFRQAPRHFGHGWACRHSLGSVRASHIKKSCGLLGPDASAKTLRGQRIGGAAQQPPRTGNAHDCKRTPDRAGNELSHCAAGRASRSAVQCKRKVKERRAVQGRGLGKLRAPAARVRWPGPLGMYVGWMARRDAVLVVAEGERPQPRPTLSRHHRVKRSAPFIWPSLIA